MKLFAYGDGGREMYKVGDYTMHGNHGICKVVEIGTLNMDVSNKEQLYYTLSPLFSKGSMVYSPIGSEKVVIRDVLSMDEANELINKIPELEIFQEINDKLMEVKLKEQIKTYQASNLLQIIKTLFMKSILKESAGKRLSTNEDRYFVQAKDLLYGELATVFSCTKEEIHEKIAEAFTSKEKMA